MAHMATDGKKFTNRPPMQQHNRSLERGAMKSQAGGAGMAQSAPPDPTAQPGMGEPDGDEQAPEQVAAEHGPATDVMIHHEHEGGQHEVHSMHPDGHEHKSMHGSAEEAHEHAKKLAGGGMEPEEDGGQEAEYE